MGDDQTTRRAPAHPQATSPRRFWLAFGGFAVLAIAVLWEEHKLHIMGALPYLILAACPLMHLLHHGHGGHHGEHGHDRDEGDRHGS